MKPTCPVCSSNAEVEDSIFTKFREPKEFYCVRCDEFFFAPETEATV